MILTANQIKQLVVVWIADSVTVCDKQWLCAAREHGETTKERVVIIVMLMNHHLHYVF